MKKLFYFDLNPIHTIAKETLYSYNKNDVEWHSTVNSPDVKLFHLLIQLKNYNQHMSLDEVAKPLFDYYREHKCFDFDEIKRMYNPVEIEFDIELIKEQISAIDENIEYVRKLNPDIIFVRHYYACEFYLLYFLEQIKDLKGVKSLGGTTYNCDITYFTDILLEENLIDNYHEGYGERHLKNLLTDNKVEKYSSDFTLLVDDFSEPTGPTHWIINTLFCSGKCKFCVANKKNNSPLKTEIDFLSDDYIEFTMNRLKYFESKGVNNIIMPTSISFYNYNHLERFYEHYKRSGVKNLSFLACHFKIEDLSDEKYVKKLKEMNFHSVKSGIEHINNDLRSDIGKYFSNEMVYRSIENLKKYDILYKFSFIYNLPSETILTMNENFNFIKDQGMNHFVMNRYNLIKETGIYASTPNLTRKTSKGGYIYYERIEQINTKLVGILKDDLLKQFIDNEDSKRLFYKKGYLEEKYH